MSKKPLAIGDHVKGGMTSKHHGYSGTVVDPNGEFIIVKSDEDSKNPLSYKSLIYGEGKFFCLARDLVVIIKDKR